MPELPEAETIARELRRRLVGLAVGAVTVSRHDIIHGDGRPIDQFLPGRKVAAVHRRAKRVIVDCDPTARLVFRLGMSGRLTIEPATASVEKHCHLQIFFPRIACELRFRDPRRFGGVWCFFDRVPDEDEAIGAVGIEPLDATLAKFSRVLDRRRQIKALLLDQHVIAGLGNIYADEALFEAGIHPLRRASALPGDTQRSLLRAIKTTLRRAIRHNGSTLMDYRNADGTEGSFQKHHRVYQREGEPCRRCGAIIRRILAAGRSSFFCPLCQPRHALRTARVKTRMGAMARRQPRRSTSRTGSGAKA